MDPNISGAQGDVSPDQGKGEDLRVDAEMELLVELALEAAPTVGVQASAELMRAGGVPLHVATRVLLFPEQRRKKSKS